VNHPPLLQSIRHRLLTTLSFIHGTHRRKQIAADLVAELKAEVATIPGRKPCIALLRVGDDPASVSYVKKKEQTAAEIGIESRVILPPVTTTQAELFALIDRLNADPGVDGIWCSRPCRNISTNSWCFAASRPPRMSTASAP